MKRILIAMILLCALVPLTSAEYNGPGATYAGLIYIGENVTWHTPSEICSNSGKGTPVYTYMYWNNVRWDGYGGGTLWNNYYIQPSTTWTVSTTEYAPLYYLQEFEDCSDGRAYGKYYNVTAGTRPATELVVDFTANVTSGNVPLFVDFTGQTNALVTDSTFNWSATGPGYVTIGNPASINTNMSFAIPGSYTVNLSVTNTSGFGYMNKVNYITATQANVTTIRTYFQAVDGTTNGAVHGANINIHDVEGNRWQNYTADTDGTGYIDAQGDHTLEGYADYSGMASTSRLALSPFDGIYELIMWPSYKLGAPGSGLPGDPGIGNVNLIVLVNDRLTGASIKYASVSITVPSGATTGGSTGDAGSEIFVVPNNSVIHIKVTKDGYTSASATITTSAMGPDTKRVELDKPTVTPTITATPLPGEATVRPTLDTRTTSQKDNDMMEQVRDAGPGLISLAILAAMFGLLKMIFKW